MDLSGLPTDQCAYGLADALERQAHALWEAKKAEEQADQFHAELGRRLSVGEAVLVDEERMVVCLPPRTGSRSVDREAVLRHAEALEPLGLAPREVASLKWPTIADIDRQSQLVRRAGIDPGDLITAAAAGGPRIEVRARKEEADGHDRAATARAWHRE